jgi:hypothetical protein
MPAWAAATCDLLSAVCCLLSAIFAGDGHVSFDEFKLWFCQASVNVDSAISSQFGLDDDGDGELDFLQHRRD